MKKLRAIVYAALAALLMLALFAGCANGADGGEQAGERTPAPAAPQAEVVSVSAAAVTVTEAEGAEYRLDDGAWQESNLFGGLTPRTDYVIRVRTADGRLCLFPARFEIDPSDYAAVGSHTVGGYVLYGENYGLSFELFVPYSVFGTDEISDYRIAAGVRSRANIPGGTETAFGAWSAAEQAAFTGVSPAQWVALADAL